MFYMHVLNTWASVCPKAGLGFIAGLEKGCALFSAYGTRVTSCSDLKPEEDTVGKKKPLNLQFLYNHSYVLQVFMVPNGRLFMIPTQGYADIHTYISTYIHRYIYNHIQGRLSHGNPTHRNAHWQTHRVGDAISPASRFSARKLLHPCGS